MRNLLICDKLGKPIALGPVQKLADSGDMALGFILQMLCGVFRAVHDSMMLILIRITAVIIRIKGIPKLMWQAWVCQFA